MSQRDSDRNGGTLSAKQRGKPQREDSKGPKGKKGTKCMKHKKDSKKETAGETRRKEVKPERQEGEKPTSTLKAAKTKEATQEKEANESLKESNESENVEIQRRALQREIQQLVVRLRSEGKTQSEIKTAKFELKAKIGEPKTMKAKKEKKDKQRTWEENASKQRKLHLQRLHDLVIIPVVWRGRHDKDDVVRAAEDIKACLTQQGLDVWLDGRRHLTPGQKFAHWEHRGVLLRVEIGPEDFKEGVCQVCLAHTPGDYQSVERKRVELPPAGTRALLLQLKEWGLTQIEVQRRDDEDEGSKVPTKRNAHEAAAQEEDVQGNWIPREGKKKARKSLKQVNRLPP